MYAKLAGIRSAIRRTFGPGRASAKNARIITNRHWKWPQGSSAVARHGGAVSRPPGRVPVARPARCTSSAVPADRTDCHAPGRLRVAGQAAPHGQPVGPRPQRDGRRLRAARQQPPHALLPHLGRLRGRCRVVRRPDGRGPRATVRGRRGRRFFGDRRPRRPRLRMRVGGGAVDAAGGRIVDTAPASTAPPHPMRLSPAHHHQSW
jgi:hypothetical protein